MMNLELRWFFEGIIPEEIIEWWNKKQLEKEELKDKGSRIDSYLVLPKPHCNILGIKSREGKLEIKYRDSSYDFVSSEGAIIGRAESWSKCSSLLMHPEKDPFRGINLPEMEVEKIRDEQRYKVELPGCKIIPAVGRVDQGIKIELTALTVQGVRWWTLAFEAFGENQKELLQCGVTNILEDYPLDKPKMSNSSSYSEWVSLIKVRD